jgi:signal transduction histidine kinase
MVDSTLRVRGVISLETFDSPVLLIPSLSCVEVQEMPPVNPFAAQSQPIASLKDAVAAPGWVHRVKVAGTVTYRDDESFFLQDKSGGVRVLVYGYHSPPIGDTVEVVGFPDVGNSVPVLSETVIRPFSGGHAFEPANLDLNDLIPEVHNGTLIRIRATLLAQKRHGTGQVLELQVGQRVSEAVLTADPDSLLALVPGSLLELTGVCVIRVVNPPPAEAGVAGNSSVASIQVLLRNASDVTLLKGPPWWTWKRTVVLIGLLLTVLVVTMIRNWFLYRRFERQKAARLAFARQMLESQEGERRRIAANLHDSLGQDLLVIKNQVHLAMQTALDNSALRQRLEGISGTAFHALEDVHQITHDLRPYQLDRLGLTKAIRSVTRRMSQNSAIVFASHVDEIDGIFDKESEIHIYRIVQEGLNNIVKHSGASEATVVLKIESTHLCISIRDNGRGFQFSGQLGENSFTGGFGLNGIRERAQILGGEAKIDSSLAQGVNLNVEIPLPSTSTCNRE